MRVAISGDEGFIAPWLAELLDADVTVLDEATLADPLRLDAALAAANALIHLTGHPPDTEDRDDRSVLKAMRDASRRVNEAVERHQGLHLLLIGSLRVHPTFDGQPWSSDTSLVPRDITAEGQLWGEERALEHASPTHPVTIVRTANVQGVPADGGEGRGLIHRVARSAVTGWVAVPASEEHAVDLLHVSELVRVVQGLLQDPPPTRETLAVGPCQPVTMGQLAQVVAQATGGAVQFWDDDTGVVWGWCEQQELGPRLGYLPECDLEAMVGEALEHLGAVPA